MVKWAVTERNQKTWRWHEHAGVTGHGTAGISEKEKKKALILKSLGQLTAGLATSEGFECSEAKKEKVGKEAETANKGKDKIK